MAYLIDNPPVRDQFYKTRNRPLTGCTVLHTAESLMDTVGPDTGAEAVAEFIRHRSDPGSYHDLCDSDSYINLVPYESGAYHDGTGSNNWALSISWACRTSDWRAMNPEKRRGFLRNGARAFAAQQAWRKANGLPLTELRRITKAQSDAGMSGFIYHGDRDPSRRTDPGKNPPNLFPFDEFIEECRADLVGASPQEEDDDMIVFVTDGGPWFAYNGFRRRYVDGSEARRLIDLGLARPEPKSIPTAALEAMPLDTTPSLGGLKPLLLDAVREGMAADNDAEADAIVDRLAQRLTGPVS